MWSALRSTVDKIRAPLMRHCAAGYGGGCPGANLPWRKGMDSPIRFTLFYLILGTLGFGAPWLVVRHQMLRDVTPPEPDIEEEFEDVDEKENEKTK